MRLTLENIGTIKEASVELNGITVIAGENNSGKSTVGRALYSVFNSFYDIEEQVYQERLQSIRKQLEITYANISNRWTNRHITPYLAEVITLIIKTI